jgi:NAD(P)-dependent dehydrogenase (short-subunit alcohol dehydrogenase family)
VIGARTGYPEEMLGADLDLEADLSIDSIKRTEIIGELAERVGLASAGARLDESIVEQLARIKTIGEIVDWIRGHLGIADEAAEGEPAEAEQDDDAARDSAGAFQSEPQATAAVARQEGGSGGGAVATAVMSGTRTEIPSVPQQADAPAAPEGPQVGAPLRQVIRLADLPALPAPEPVAGRFAGRRFVIVDDGCGIALELADLLEQQGAQVRTPLEPDGPCDGLIHLAALRPGGGPVLPGAYGGIREALAGGLRWLVLASGSGGTFGRGFDGSGIGDPTAGAGLRGLARTIAQEYPEVLVRAVDVDTKDIPRAVALRILAEMLDTEAPVEVGLDGDARRTLTVAPAELPTLNGDADPAAHGLDLDESGVVLLTGGARGITARVARRLARTTGCHIEIIGRTPEPKPEAAGEPGSETGELDAIGLRRALVAQGGRTPAEIEAAIRRILAEREVRATLEELRGAAASVRYHAADVRDPQAVRAVVEDVYARHGRLDGVIHGAGLLEDRLVRDKEPESFNRVYRTKVDGACALAAAVRPDLRFFVVFGSISGVCGNRGQADYAAANDACDTLAQVWRTELRGRVLVADWGPWAGGGMVSPELAREYARRGLALIEPEAGVSALLREIAHGDEPQVVFTGTAR